MAAGTLSAGDSYQIQRGSLLQICGAMTCANGAALVIQDIAFGASPNVTTPGSTVPIYNRCSFGGGPSGANVLVSGLYQHCFFADDISIVGGAGIVAGALILNGGNCGSSVLEFFADTYVTTNNAQFAFLCETNQFGNVSVFAGVGAGIQLQDIPNATGALIVGSTPPLLTATDENGNALVWGNGNTGLGIAILPGATATVPAGAAVVPTVTGAQGDWGFVGQNGGALVKAARPWNEAGNAYGASAAASWPNFSGAAFGFQAFNNATRAGLVGI
jgi:hypothetical protein